MRPIVVLANADANVRGGAVLDAIAAQGNARTVEAVCEALRALGPVEKLATATGSPEELARALKARAPRVVFNLAEAARGVAALEPAVAALLDLLGLAYTGNGPQALALGLDKHAAKALLRGSGVTVPAGALLRDAWRDPLVDVLYPAIVKPACMDASHGIEPHNVVQDEAAARALAAELIARFPPAAIVEQFVDGREIMASVVQLEPGGPPQVLPLAEIDWHLPPGTPRVCGYAAKWLEESEAYRGTPVICPAPLDPDLEREVRDTALAAFLALGCRDYARVDMRVDSENQVYVLEVNPNPDLDPTAGLARSARVAGWSYDDFIRRIAANAERRGPLAPLAQSG
ncbi:MAG: D-alanine-D-alanine ligase [Chloroflexota bacterium]|nr:D-alanine-D-alanine ligase [Chloroflexota bacterium]